LARRAGRILIANIFIRATALALILVGWIALPIEVRWLLGQCRGSANDHKHDYGADDDYLFYHFTLLGRYIENLKIVGAVM